MGRLWVGECVCKLEVWKKNRSLESLNEWAWAKLYRAIHVGSAVLPQVNIALKYINYTSEYVHDTSQSREFGARWKKWLRWFDYRKFRKNWHWSLYFGDCRLRLVKWLGLDSLTCIPLWRVGTKRAKNFSWWGPLNVAEGANVACRVSEYRCAAGSRSWWRGADSERAAEVNKSLWVWVGVVDLLWETKKWGTIVLTLIAVLALWTIIILLVASFVLVAI